MPDSGTSAEAEKTFARIDRTIRTEHPDLIVFTGDVVTGRPAAGMWQRLLDTLVRRGVPYCIVLGNHDAEQDLPRTGDSAAGHIGQGEPQHARGVGRVGGCRASRFTDRQPRGLPPCFTASIHTTTRRWRGSTDTAGSVRNRSHGCGKACEARTSANNGIALPGLAFFHIPLPEYVTAWRNPGNTRIGRAAEKECPGVLNPGMFAAMVESRSIVGTFTGHDHDIDYLVAEQGIALGYGRFSGDNTTYNNLRPGVRVIVLKEGVRGFETWIREDDGRIVDHARFEGGKNRQAQRVSLQEQSRPCFLKRTKKTGRTIGLSFCGRRIPRWNRPPVRSSANYFAASVVSAQAPQAAVESHFSAQAPQAAESHFSAQAPQAAASVVAALP